MMFSEINEEEEDEEASLCVSWQSKVPLSLLSF